MTENESSPQTWEYGIFSDNNDDRFSNNLFEDALFATLSVDEKEQVKKAKEQALKSVSFQDGVNDYSQALGGGTQDLTTAGLNIFTRRNLSWQIPKQDAIMRDIPYFDKASSWKATRALINGIDLNSKKHDSDELNDVKTDLASEFFSLHTTVKLGDFNGAAGGLLVFDDCIDKDDYKKPLIYSKIEKNSYKGIRTLTRYYQIMPAFDKGLVTRIGDDIGIYSAYEIGQPTYYRINFSGNYEAEHKWFEVHRSRVLWYTSIELTYIEKRIELNGGPSLLERSYTDFSRYEAVVGQTNKLAQRSNIPILNIKGLPQASLNSTAFVNRVMQKIKTINYSASVGNMVLLGDKNNEEFKFENANFTGLLEILRHERQNLASALEAPTSVLFNEPDDNDEDVYFTKVKEIQEGKIRRWYNRLIPILYRNRFGKNIKDFSFTFKSLEYVSEQDKATRFKTIVEALQILYEMELIDVISGQNMLKVAMENISDIPHEITKEYIDYLFEESKSKPFTKKQRDIDVAIALNHLQGNAGENGGNTSNPVESAINGEIQGGKESTKKPTTEVPITKEKE